MDADDREPKNENAAALSALGASKGGKTRAARLSPDRRREIATKAAIKRWGVEPVRATHAGVIKLSDGDVGLACANLPDGRRVISESAMLAALGRGYSGYYSQRDALAPQGSAVPPRYLSPAVLRPFVSKELIGLQLTPYLTPNGALAKGVDAELVPTICEVWLKAREAGVLTKAQLRTAAKAEIILRGLARVGIVALVDEATGYQAERPQDALQAYLNRILRHELAAWVKRFPDEFYENIYKLRGWPWPGMKKNRYSVVAHYTRDLVYERLAPGLLRELEARTPPNERGNRPNKLHEWLNDEVGDPMLAQHLHALMMLQRVAIASGAGWRAFVRMVDQAMPKRGDNLELPLGSGDAT